MLNVSSSVLLLTKDKAFAEYFKETALSCDVQVAVKARWDRTYRIREDVVVCESEWADRINDKCRSKTVILLKKDESFIGLKNKGFTRFVFDTADERQLIYSLMTENEVRKAKVDGGVFTDGEYDFNFTTKVFKYKNKGIYLTKGEQSYLADWLLGEYKDNNKRFMLFAMRKKFGKDFLKEIGRDGKVKDSDV